MNKQTKTYVKMKGPTTITVTRDLRDRLMTLKIKTQAQNLNDVLEGLIK